MFHGHKIVSQSILVKIIIYPFITTPVNNENGMTHNKSFVVSFTSRVKRIRSGKKKGIIKSIK
jgi:hypothetical protein